MQSLTKETDISEHGFTLIELIVVAGILILFLSMGMINYSAFTNRQRLAKEAKRLKTVIRQAQIAAQTNTQPANCNTLQNVQIQFTNALNYKVDTVCGNFSNGDERTYTLTDGVSIANYGSSTLTTIIFNVLSKGVTFSSGTSSTICLWFFSNPSKYYKLVVDSGGSVTEAPFVSSCP